MDSPADLVRALVASGLSLSATARRLDELGIPSPGGNGKPWHSQQIARMVDRAPTARASGSSPPAPQPERTPPLALADDAPLAERLRERRREMERVARQAEELASLTAAVAARRACVDLDERIDAAERPAVVPDGDPTENMTDDEITAGICAAVAGWPEDVLDAVEEAIDRARGIRPPSEQPPAQRNQNGLDGR